MATVASSATVRGAGRAGPSGRPTRCGVCPSSAITGQRLVLGTAHGASGHGAGRLSRRAAAAIRGDPLL